MTKKTTDSMTPKKIAGRGGRTTLLALGAAAMLLAPVVASAQPAADGGPVPVPAVGGPGGGGGPGAGWRGRGRGGKGFHGKGFAGRKQAKLANMKKALNLTDAQVAQMKAVRKAQQQQMAKLRLEVARVRASMRVEWLKDQPDETALRTLQAKMSTVMAQKAKLRFEGRLKIANILTPEQRVKAKQLGLTMGKGRFGGHGKGRFGGHGKGRFGGHGKGRMGGGW